MTTQFNVMGVDISRGSPLSSRFPLYAVVIINSEGGVVYSASDVPLPRLLRLVWSYRVNKMATDNVFELAPSIKKLTKIVNLLPEYTEIVQVTIDDGVFKSIAELSRRAGIDVRSKPTPLQTAFIAAWLALNNFGTPIRVVERRVRVVISRARSVGSGGSSSQRFARGMRTAVLRAAKVLKRELDKLGIDYEMFLKKGRGGLERAVFIVYASREQLHGIIRKFSGSDVNVYIKPEYRVEFNIGSMDRTLKRRFLIVGIDPGIETGVAAIDLGIDFIYMKTFRDAARSDIISEILSAGIPVMVATDKVPPPDAVKRIAAALGVPLYAPPRSLSVDEKLALVEWLKKRINVSPNTSHERDALAAAIKAYRMFESNLRELDSRLKAMGIDLDDDELKLMLLKGYSIEEVIERALENELSEDEVEQTSYQGQSAERTKHREEEQRRIKELEKRVTELVIEKESLLKKIRELEGKIEELIARNYVSQSSIEEDKGRAEYLVEERMRSLQLYITKLENEISELKKTLDTYRSIIQGLAEENLVTVPVAEDLTKSSRDAIELGLKRGVLFVLRNNIDAEVVEGLKKENLAIILNTCDSFSENLLLDLGIATTCGVKPRAVLESVAFIDEQTLRSSIERARRAVEEREEHKRRRGKIIESLDQLIKLVEEYRSQVMSEYMSKNA